MQNHVNRCFDRKFELNSAVSVENPVELCQEDAATKSLAIDCKPILSIQSGKPVGFQNVNLHVDLTNITSLSWNERIIIQFI